MHALVCLAQQRFYLYMTNIYISESENCWLAAVAALPTCIMVRTAADLHHVRRRPYDALDRRHFLRHVRPGRLTSLYVQEPSYQSSAYMSLIFCTQLLFVSPQMYQVSICYVHRAIHHHVQSSYKIAAK